MEDQTNDLQSRWLARLGVAVDDRGVAGAGGILPVSRGGARERRDDRGRERGHVRSRGTAGGRGRDRGRVGGPASGRVVRARERGRIDRERARSRVRPARPRGGSERGRDMTDIGLDDSDEWNDLALTALANLF